jgi:RimJ/RimL family protein N-acetyltransferase
VLLHERLLVERRPHLRREDEALVGDVQGLRGAHWVDEWHGPGLARRLLGMLIDRSRASGFQRMEGHVLATNVDMLNLAKRLGFAELASSEGPTVRLVRRHLA